MRLIVTCSGISNTGKLTTQVATALMRSRPGAFVWVKAQKPPGEIQACAGDAEELVVIDGCSDCCATKKIRAAGVGLPCRCHVVATECGVVKNGMADVQYGEIEQVMREVARILGGLR
ncbi:MAG: putative zinc-binding protein [Methanomicrobiales archaeon]|nr:putative zinc-binding protein [Methanomicrobiales archaeon]MDI6875736.1 putative zinc-binding protein [Methanomicrobiales archaeon]